MAKVTIIIKDIGNEAHVEFIPEPDFDVEKDTLTNAQLVAMEAMQAIEEACEIDDKHSPTMLQ